MDFFLTRGKDFKESFDFKSPDGRSIVVPQGTYRVLLSRGGFVREYTVNNGLTRTRNSIVWQISKEDSKSFEFNTLYYTLYMGDTEIVRGVLKLQ